MEVICALAILLIIMLPIYQGVTHTLLIQRRTQVQLLANSLAQSEMEGLKNQLSLEEGLRTFEDTLNSSGLFVETKVEVLESDLALEPIKPVWHLKMVFENTYVFLIGNVAKIDIYDNTGNHKGTAYAKTILNNTGLVCTLNYNNTLNFAGLLGYVRFNSSQLKNLGIDFSKPGTAQSNLIIKCEGSIAESLDFYFNVEGLQPSAPKYEVKVYNSVERLNIKSWPGANRNMRLSTEPYENDGTKFYDRIYRLLVRVFESEDSYRDGQDELIFIKSLRHDVILE